MEQRSLAGYSPWESKELDTPERLSIHAGWRDSKSEMFLVKGIYRVSPAGSSPSQAGVLMPQGVHQNVFIDPDCYCPSEKENSHLLCPEGSDDGDSGLSVFGGVVSLQDPGGSLVPAGASSSPRSSGWRVLSLFTAMPVTTRSAQKPAAQKAFVLLEIFAQRAGYPIRPWSNSGDMGWLRKDCRGERGWARVSGEGSQLLPSGASLSVGLQLAVPWTEGLRPVQKAVSTLGAAGCGPVAQ